MSCWVGIDIGAVSATAALLTDQPAASTDAELGGFRRAPSDGSDRAIYLSEYRRTRGKPVAAATELLEQVIAAVGSEAVRGLCLTGSGSKLAASTLGAAVVNEFKAIAAGLDAYITGEAAEHVQELAREERTTYVAAGHYRTETFGVRALGERLEREFGLEWTFIDVPNPV